MKNKPRNLSKNTDIQNLQFYIFFPVEEYFWFKQSILNSALPYLPKLSIYQNSFLYTSIV